MVSVEFTATKELVEAFKQAAAVAPKKAPHKGILECVMLTVSSETVTLEATDLQTYYRRTVMADSIDAPIPLSAAIHRSAAKALKPGTRVTLTERSYTVGPVTSPSDDPLAFPNFPRVYDGKEVTVDPTYFAALASCAAFASNSEVRPALKGVCHRGRTLVATDGVCLLQADAGGEFGQAVNLPADAVAILKRVFGKTGAVLVYDTDHALFQQADTRVVVRLQDGTYPDVSHLFKDGQKVKFYIHDTKPWLAALDDVITMHKLAGTPNDRHIVRLRQEGHTVTLSAHGAGSSFSATLEVGGPVGDWEYQTNAANLRKALAHAVGSVTVCAGAPNQPLLLESESRKALVSAVLTY
ncbi:MAG: hypothetical protein K6T81_09525 [Alicyclobacillus macrosporangiidus]|uniref:hypothetical protein n=1 Tax=Alicyclobacillus macrosporangiidus TaxID=392015 RepID=UPI0026F0449E|nr:hypothetical protein [Alicyclobacillus macrosporangiidus]MCL6598970.1 hypothetical protein [Alicyclobacillus macrosporangiidus]